MMASTGNRAIAVIGNPGTGKSTILNGMVGTAAFKAGLAMGTGMTMRLQKHVVGNMTYYDTPGLTDVKKRKEAAAELDRLLRTDESLKLIFVVMVRNGRVSPEDPLTIALVLDAITSVDANDRFGVILNQVTPRFLENMRSDAHVEASVRSQITGAHHTSYWAYVPLDSALVEQDDETLTTPELQHLFDSVPETRPVHATITAVNTASFQERRKVERQAFKQKEGKIMNQLQRQHDMLAQRGEELTCMKERLRSGKQEMRRGDAEALENRERLEKRVKRGQDRVRNAESAEQQTMESLQRERQRARRRARRARAAVGNLRRELHRHRAATTTDSDSDSDSSEEGDGWPRDRVTMRCGRSSGSHNTRRSDGNQEQEGCIVC